MVQGRATMAARLLGIGLALLPLFGCGSFFQCENKPACPASTTSTGTDTSTVNLAFVAYTSTAGVSTLVEYNLAAGALTQVTSFTLPYLPTAMAVSPSNGFLYIATVPGATNPGIYGYSISSAGALTALNSGGALATDAVGAMTISPDGNYLYTLLASGITMTEYSFTSTGTLTTAGAVGISALNCALTPGRPVSPSCSVAVSPRSDFLVGSFGTAGDEIFPYASSGGLSETGVYDILPGTASGEFSVAMDDSDNAYVAQTAGLTVYGLASTGATNRGTVTYASGVVPRSVTLDAGYKFVFTANEGNGTISAFTTGTSTALTAVTGSPFTGPAHVAALGADSSDSYLVAVGYDATAGTRLYAVSSAGVLSLVASAATTTATQYPVLVAMSH